MSKRKMTVEYLRAMVKKSFANVDIDEDCKMCVLPFQSLVDTVNLYEDKLAWQEVEIQQLTEENAELQKQVGELNELSDGYFTKAYFYYQKCKAYGIENFYDDELEPKPAKEGKTITFPKFEHIEVE